MENIVRVPPNTTHNFTVPAHDAGQRLDLYLTQQFPSYSRTFFQQLIVQELVSIKNKKKVKPRTLTKSDDLITVTFPPVVTRRPQKEIPNDLDISIVHTDEHFLVINKPINLMVHPPTITSEDFTLVDWLMHTFQDISDVGVADRPGIVHRLDKDTSGIMLVARNNCALTMLGDIFRKRDIQKTYLAIVSGHPEKEGTISLSIKRHSVKRNTMVAVPPETKTNGTLRSACTHYRVLEYFDDCSLVEVKPVTGRTHQIRVHFAALGHPLVGDYIYGKKSKKIARQALHAYKLSFKFNGKQYDFCQQPPQDFQSFLEIKRNN